ncbi:MAG: hypothetical protein IPF61_06730 [Xanthomonadales bacterium]|nr:hypothetical protein [Xanthomonadales bacterium]
MILLIAPFTPQIPGCIAAHRSKSGKVVDVETGKGLPNAFVISSARFVSGPLFFGPSGNVVLYNIIVRTDAEGRFSIPSTWSDLHIGTPGTHPGVTWVVTVFEPGYAVVGDEKAWLYMDNYGMPRFLPRSTARTPELSTADQWLGNLGTIQNVQALVHVEAGSFLLQQGQGHKQSIFRFDAPGRRGDTQEGL